MRIKVLMEDCAKAPYDFEHGLSLYLQTAQHKILFDMGKSDLFLKNAKKMDVDLSQVDLAVLSHGHYDHGGGLSAFLKQNHRAQVYLHEKATEGHYARRSHDSIDDIGVSIGRLDLSRIHTVCGDQQIDEGLLLFSSVSGQKLRSQSNHVLLIKTESGFVKDPFEHEQNLLICENGKKVLISGCAHRGIVNILDCAMELAGGAMDVVIGGFHLSNPSKGTCEPDATLDGIAEYLMRFPTKYATCHCTGVTAYQKLRQKMGDQIQYISAGDHLVI